jgi:hypothetical protein
MFDVAVAITPNASDCSYLLGGSQSQLGSALFLVATYLYERTIAALLLTKAGYQVRKRSGDEYLQLI